MRADRIEDALLAGMGDTDAADRLWARNLAKSLTGRSVLPASEIVRGDDWWPEGVSREA